MNTIPKTPSPGIPEEKERFWKEHEKKQRESGLSKKAYCREHQLRPNQFFYWERKLREEMNSSGELLPVNFNLTGVLGTERKKVLSLPVFISSVQLKIGLF